MLRQMETRRLAQEVVQPECDAVIDHRLHRIAASGRSEGAGTEERVIDVEEERAERSHRAYRMRSMGDTRHESTARGRPELALSRRTSALRTVQSSSQGRPTSVHALEPPRCARVAVRTPVVLAGAEPHRCAQRGGGEREGCR